MIILACDGCGVQSPNAKGERIADDWTNVTFQSQRQRNRDNQGVRLVLCEDCLPKLGSSLSLDHMGVEMPRMPGFRGH